jgi:hypothetical protein
MIHTQTHTPFVLYSQQTGTHPFFRMVCDVNNRWVFLWYAISISGHFWWNNRYIQIYSTHTRTFVQNIFSFQDSCYNGWRFTVLFHFLSHKTCHGGVMFSLIERYLPLLQSQLLHIVTTHISNCIPHVYFSIHSEFRKQTKINEDICTHTALYLIVCCIMNTQCLYIRYISPPTHTHSRTYTHTILTTTHTLHIPLLFFIWYFYCKYKLVLEFCC